MKRAKLLLTALLLTLSGCHSGEPTTPEGTGEMPYGMWEFAFFTPKSLPADVVYVGIIDNRKILYSFRTLDSVQDSWVTVDTWSNKVRRHALFNKARHPPVAMLICWDSTIDKKTYETKAIFPESMRERMSVSTGLDSYGEKAWYNTLLFGLAPGGKVKIWLQNTVGGNGSLPIEPVKIVTVSGEKLEGCKGITQHTQGYRYTKTTEDFIKGKTYPYGDW
ncbi:MAG TPA: DUF2931 family protein [Scandinavium sp.]|jgi:hypothetical protein|uniref:DUF2931 family protein n=1 Tax=Scandinavium sp. TaxID=2830653 RepID=UPI002E35DB68|nr:DUF2931 family protein [Scandinavium sp.]HEX4501755.1 DUF2931 family protein [Scandinavium sp.]